MPLAALVLAVLGTSLAPSPPASPPAREPVLVATSVLHAWDARRASAWATGDPRALGSLYVAGSAAGRADRRLLQAYADRGLVVGRMVTQVFAVRVLHLDAREVRIGLVDRIAGGEVHDGARVRPLGASPVERRVVDLRIVGGRWRVASVSRWGRGPRAARQRRRGRRR